MEHILKLFQEILHKKKLLDQQEKPDDKLLASLYLDIQFFLATTADDSKLDSSSRKRLKKIRPLIETLSKNNCFKNVKFKPSVIKFLVQEIKLKFNPDNLTHHSKKYFEFHIEQIGKVAKNKKLLSSLTSITKALKAVQKNQLQDQIQKSKELLTTLVLNFDEAFDKINKDDTYNKIINHGSIKGFPLTDIYHTYLGHINSIIKKGLKKGRHSATIQKQIQLLKEFSDETKQNIIKKQKLTGFQKFFLLDHNHFTADAYTDFILWRFATKLYLCIKDSSLAQKKKRKITFLKKLANSYYEQVILKSKTQKLFEFESDALKRFITLHHKAFLLPVPKDFDIFIDQFMPSTDKRGALLHEMNAHKMISKAQSTLWFIDYSQHYNHLFAQASHQFSKGLIYIKKYLNGVSPSTYIPELSEWRLQTLKLIKLIRSAVKSKSFPFNYSHLE